MSTPDIRARHSVLGIIALSLFAALFTRLWYLQVLTTDDYELAARSGRTQTVILEAPRGRILDRQGKLLVENRRTIQVQIDYQDFVDLDTPEQSALLRRLAQKLTEDDYLRWADVRVPDDPGPRPDTTVPETTTPPVEGEADETTTTSTTTVPLEPQDDDQASALDPTNVPVGDDLNRPPPAGVATGAENPDGQGGTTRAQPEPVTEEALRDAIEDPRYSKFKPVPVATGVSEELEIYLTEHPEEFPTVNVERVTARTYNYGALLAHVLGYVGSITEDELEEFQNDDKPYENDDDIGKAGIERGMERELRGVPGEVVYEVDARNRPIRVLSRTEPVPGRDVFLTVDINMQYMVEKGLAAEVERRRGVVDRGCFVVNEDQSGCQPRGAASIAIDPRNGQVLAMASYPTYDPNLFVGGISKDDYEALKGDDSNDPLLNRVIGGTWAPGSTFKLFSSYAGLANDLITPETTYFDSGVYKYSEDCPVDQDNNCSAQNAARSANGNVSLTQALTVSSDTFYYWLGDTSWRQRGTLGEEAMQQRMIMWGLGNKTGIGLPGEAAGRIPTPRWLMDFSREINEGKMPEAEVVERGTWTAGTSGNTMVGQGDVLVTPLQLALGYATLANGGTIYKPQLVIQVTDYSSDENVVVPDAEAVGQVDFQPGWREALVEGFDGVTKSGTAAGGFEGVDQSVCPIAGKTGTAQVTGKNDTSLFTAFAPTPTDGRTSTIAMATVFDEAGFGAQAAVPLTRRILQPFADVGCDINAFGTDERWSAPLGGWFDVEEAMGEFVPRIDGATED